MINTILSHKSIRKFRNNDIPDELLQNILFAGTRASTTGNMQAYSIIVTSDKEQKNKLWQAHFKQNMVLEAPLHLTFCADFNRFSEWCKIRKAEPGYDNFLSFFTAAIDALLVSQNIALAAESLGLGICYLGTATYNAHLLIEILELPKLVVPVASIVLGYPAENPGLTDRLPLEGVVHTEKYKNYGSADIDRIYAEKENLEQTKELLKINQKETLAQIFADKRYPKKDNQFFSLRYMKTIADQGFMQNE
jgi:nitroreductase